MAKPSMAKSRSDAYIAKATAARSNAATQQNDSGKKNSLTLSQGNLIATHSWEAPHCYDAMALLWMLRIAVDATHC